MSQLKTTKQSKPRPVTWAESHARKKREEGGGVVKVAYRFAKSDLDVDVLGNSTACINLNWVTFGTACINLKLGNFWKPLTVSPLPNISAPTPHPQVY